MKKLLIGLMILSGLVFAEEVIVNPTLEKIEIKDNLLPDDEIYINCNYKSKLLFGFIGGWFEEKVYDNVPIVNKLIRQACGISKKETNNIQTITYDKLNKISNNLKLKEEIVLHKNFDFFKSSKRIDSKYLNDYLFLLQFEEKYKDENIAFPIARSNSELILNFKIRYENYKTFTEKKKLKNYNNTNPTLKSKFTFNSDLIFLPKVFTNTYDIDSTKECIDGNIWIKKYGNTAGDKCAWIEKQ